MNHWNSAIELSSSFQAEIRQEKVAFYLSNVLCEWFQEKFQSRLLEKLQENQKQTTLFFNENSSKGQKLIKQSLN